jgi:hypothetical protein
MTTQVVIGSAGGSAVVFALVGVAAGALVALVAPRLSDTLTARRRERESRKRLSERDLEFAATSPTENRKALSHPPQDLVAAVAEGRCVLYGGSGLSSYAGLPTGNALLAAMIDHMEQLTPAEDWTVLREQLDQGQTALVSELLRRRLGNDLREVLISIFRKTRTARTSEFFESLGRIEFVGLVTDQWDDLITQPFARRDPVRLTPRTSSNAGELLRDERFFTLKLYGDLNDSTDLLFTVEDYREAIRDERSFASVVATLLASRTFLFLGASVRQIEEFFTASGVRAPASQSHVALVENQRGFSLVAERMKDRYGVTLISFDVEEGSRPVEAFVEALRTAGKKAVSHPRRLSETMRLERIDLENIGPFDQLDIELGNDWTILLGDNAAGKSTVLRAVALALAGESRPTIAPNRMLRSGASAGKISILVGGARYTTELRRESDRVVRATADAVTPIQAGTWLALGFPPLRGVSNQEPRGATMSPASAPSADDVLPLLENNVDLRLNDVKQWVFTTWLIGNERGASRAIRSRAMLEHFFELLGRLTPGVDFTFRGVNADTREIELDSPDGAISIDLLSQGISSLLAWVGVLLERLYEAYDDDRDPASRGALVLVDEIDAHLHPDWQKRLLPELRDVFPAIQLVATTHSPLMVGNTLPGEVIHLERRGGARALRQLDVTFQGLRADQILTSVAFELDSTRDQKTTEELDEYCALMARAKFTPNEAARLAELSERLRERLPYPQETEGERRQAASVDELAAHTLRCQLTELSVEQRQALADEAQTFLEGLGDDQGEK